RRAICWREVFVHTAGMHTNELERCADWRRVAPLTRALLERSWLEVRLRVQNAEERLADFSVRGHVVRLLAPGRRRRWVQPPPHRIGAGRSPPELSPQPLRAVIRIMAAVYH